MQFKYFLAFLAIGSVSVAHAQDATSPGVAGDGIAKKRQDEVRPGAQRRAKRGADDGPGCTLSVTPHVVLTPGQQVRLSWTTRNATSAKLEGRGTVSLAPQQQKVVDRPDRTKVYEMEVSGPTGTGTCRVAVAVPQRVEPLQWPPAAMAGMPADYLARARASLAEAITGANLVDDFRWIGYATSSLLFEQDVEAINSYLAGPWQAPQHPELGFGLFSMNTVRLYGLFNSRSGNYPGRLTPAAQRNMEAEFYKVVSQTRFNDYRHAIDLDNVWTIPGSDNHIFAARSSSLFAAQFLKNSPDFANRPFEDGRKPAEHYEAWRKYWSKVLDERAKRGIYIEVGSPHYEDETRQAIQNIRDFAEDPILRQKAEMLLDLTYALIAQDSLRNAVRGGAKSRVYTFKDKFFSGGDDRNYNLIFGPPGFVPARSDQASSTYYPPPVVLKLGRDIAARGSYETRQRVPGVGERTERVVSKVEAEKSVLRYGFVTPSYVMGSFVLDPGAPYTPMSGQNRWQGVVFEGDRSARMAPRIARLAKNGALQSEQRVLDGFASLQDRNVLITQRSDGKGGANVRVEIYVSGAFDQMEEEDGWIFTREGAAFGAVRIVGSTAGAYRWFTPEKNKNSDPNKNFVALQDPNAPIIFVASDASDYANDFGKFKAALKSQKVEHDRQTVRFAGLTFYGAQKVGSRDGAKVDVAPARLYDSPFLRSQWESGKIFLRFGNDAAILDFSDPAKPRKELSATLGAEFPPGVGRAKPIIFSP